MNLSREGYIMISDVKSVFEGEGKCHREIKVCLSVRVECPRWGKGCV